MRGTKWWIVGAVCTLVGCTSPPEETAPAPAAQEPARQVEAPPAGDPTAELFVDVEAEPDEGAPPLSVQFTAEVEDNTGSVECTWDFGDGSATMTGLRPMHVFSTVEDYEVVARCKDSTGVEGEGEVDVFVEAD